MFLMKKEVRKEEKKKVVSGEGKSKTPGELRFQKEIEDLEKDLDANIKIAFPNKDNIMEFEISIKLDDPASLWYPGTYKFKVNIPPAYPHEPPKCICLTKIYHPNIEISGNVCLPIIRADWKPTLGINILVIGLKMILSEPNADDPLNKEAAEVMRTNPELFKETVKKSLKGGSFKGETFPKFL